MLVLRNINPAGSGKEGRYDSFFAGLLGGYAVFGRQPGSISQQVGIPLLRTDRTGGNGHIPSLTTNRPRMLIIPDRHLRVRTRDALPRQTLHPTRHAPALLPHQPRSPHPNHQQRLARLRQSELGFRHVHFPLVPGHPGIESAEQHGLHVSASPKPRNGSTTTI